jgi:hypothetical protein
VCLPLWRAGTANGLDLSPAVAYGFVYASVGPGLTVYDAAGVTNCTGTPAQCNPVWTSRNLTDGPTSSPIVGGGLVFVGTEISTIPSYGVSAFDAHGVFNCSSGTCPSIWKGTVTEPVSQSQSPAVANGWLYTSAGEQLFAFKLK